MTVIIIPQSRPTTQTHEFTGVSEAGREVSISVVATIDIQPSAVLADLRGSMPGISDLSFKEQSDPGLLGTMGILLVLWIFLAIVVALICLVVGAADFVDFYARWPEYIPIAGGERIARGMFRVWVAAIPVICVAFPLLIWLFDRKDTDAMKVGR
jgi:hypothetical protein